MKVINPRIIKDIPAVDIALSNLTARTPAVALGWVSIAYANNLFVAGSQTGTTNMIMTSPDGITWTGRTTPSGAYAVYQILFAKSKWIAVCSLNTYTMRIITSPDAITWTTVSSLNIARVVFDEINTFVGVNGDDGKLYSSTDCITWTALANQPFGVDPLEMSYSVNYINGKWYAFSGTDSPSYKVSTSTDLVNWTISTGPSLGSFRYISRTAFKDGVFVGVTNSGDVFTSSNGLQWKFTNYTAPAGVKNKIVVTNGWFVICGSNCVVSKDGINWKNIELSVGITANIYDLVFARGRYYTMNTGTPTTSLGISV